MNITKNNNQEEKSEVDIVLPSNSEMRNQQNFWDDAEREQPSIGEGTQKSYSVNFFDNKNQQIDIHAIDLADRDSAQVVINHESRQSSQLSHQLHQNQMIVGEPSEEESIRGYAVDFCHVVTQGRNVQDTALEVRGAVATRWMSIAQCFAGGAVDPPAPGTRVG